MNATPPLSRRRFLQRSALASSVLILPRGLPGASGRSPNEKLNLALVGVGGRGRVALAALEDENLVAFCDVDEVRGRQDLLANADGRKTRPLLEKFSAAKWFKDYRVMFDQMADKIDGVVISTPDHMHAPIAMTAIAHRKHVYIEKPLCRCITEVRALQKAARAAGVITQMGNQGRASEGIRIAREWVQAGVIGNVTRVDTFSDRPVGPWFLDPEFDPDAAAADMAPPPTLDWNLWLGSSPLRPYRKEFLPMHWRGFVDYGCGSLGDMGCHQIDAAFYALDLDAPTSVEAVTSTLYPKTFPQSSIVTYRFPARGRRPAVELRWIDGGLLPTRPPGVSAAEWKNPRNGSLFFGEKGTLLVGSHSASVQLLPESRMQDLRASPPAKTIPRVKGGPHLEWVTAIRGGPACGSAFDYSGPLTETVLLGIAAIRAQARLEWNSAAMKVTNEPDANRFIGPGYDYRPGWGV